MGATESTDGFARTRPEGGCFERGGGVGQSRGAVCKLLFVCVFEKVLTGDR